MGSVSQQRLYILDAGFSEGTPFRGRILSCQTDGTDLQTVIDNIHTLPDGIAIDRQNGHMYWTNMGTSFKTNSGSIERANLDGSNRTMIVAPGTIGVFTPKQITIAKRARKLYWCDREGMKVMRANLDGSDVEVLVSTGHTAEDRLDQSKWCVGIAVDELRGVFYWTQKGPSKGGQGRIFKAPISAVETTTTTTTPTTTTAAAGRGGGGGGCSVVFDKLPEPIDLELDETSQTLYWTDRGDPPTGNSLNRAAMGLAGQRQVLAKRLHETIGLALDRDGDVVYVTDLAGGVYAIDIKKRTKTVLFTELGDITGIALVE